LTGLSVRHLSKSFEKKQVLADISFEIQQGEIVVLLGPSGCGKSTLLGLVAGLDSPDQGEILWAGESLAGIPPHQRGFGLMFQDFALFPHRNVFDNVAFGLVMAHLPRQAIQERVTQVLELVGLPGFERRDVNTLSGGEQQRVALARSLAPGPRLLMLDEPLGSLDRSLRERLVNDLRAVLRHSQQTALYVTHDQEEAFALADRVVLMNEGRIEQSGTPQELYHQPASIFAARFLGMNNLLPAEVHQDGKGWILSTPLGNFPLPAPHPPGPVVVLLRPDAVEIAEEYFRAEEDFRLEDEPSAISSTCGFIAILLDRSFRGSFWQVSVQAGEVILQFEIQSRQNVPQPGETISLCFDPAKALQVYQVEMQNHLNH
jgi:ABC-type Fe3+/spermidine/putrescine transport system ATPase subunit